MVAFVQSGFFGTKLIVFGQIFFIPGKLLYLGKNGWNRAKVVVLEKSG